MKAPYEIIVVGASAGGFKALQIFLAGLPFYFQLPVIIVQHRITTSDDYLVKALDRCCAVPVKEVMEKEKMKAGSVYLAPPDYHVLIEKNGTFSLSVDDHVNFSRPSIDVLFESAADAYKEKIIAIILTGANADGSCGIRKIHETGGLTIAQNPESAESAVMPLSAIETQCIDLILPLEDIAPLLRDLVEEMYGKAIGKTQDTDC